MIAQTPYDVETALRSHTILIMDNEVRPTYELESAFGERYSVLRGHGMTRCKELLLEQMPDVVILDLQTLGEEGTAAVREIRRIHPFIPLFVLTNSATEEMIQCAMKIGADTVVTKPYQVEALQHLQVVHHRIQQQGVG